MPPQEVCDGENLSLGVPVGVYLWNVKPVLRGLRTDSEERPGGSDPVESGARSSRLGPDSRVSSLVLTPQYKVR